MNSPSLSLKSIDSHSSNLNVLVIGFNRSDLLEESLKRLETYGNCNVWVSIDAPRSGNSRDKKENAQIRHVLSHFGIPSNQIQMGSFNLGCRNGVIAAISWFFEHNESGIILEDDIEIDEGYLLCMQCLLSKFRDDQSVTSISSHSELARNNSLRRSDELVLMPLCRVWGWGAWRDSWLMHMKIMKKTENYSLRKLFELIPKSYRTFDAALRLYHCKNNMFDTWDYEWNLTHLLTESGSITPCNNYCLNHGFGEHATHTLDPEGSPWTKLESFDSSLLRQSSISIDKASVEEAITILNHCGFPKPEKPIKEKLKLFKHQMKACWRRQ